MRKRIYFLGLTIWSFGFQVFLLIVWILFICMFFNGRKEFNFDPHSLLELIIFGVLFFLSILYSFPYWIDFIFFQVKVIKGNAYECGTIGSSRSWSNGVGSKIRVTDENGKVKTLRLFHEVLKYSMKDNTDMPFQKYNYVEIYYLPCTKYVIDIKFYKKKHK